MGCRQNQTAAAAFLAFATTYVLFHVAHLGGFSAGDVFGLVVARVLDALLPLALLVLAGRLLDQRLDRQAVVGSGFRSAGWRTSLSGARLSGARTEVRSRKNSCATKAVEAGR
jgi:hypothetical protein